MEHVKRLVNGKLPRTYRKWTSMIQRCYNPNHLAWKWYGGKGVTVCQRWRGSYDAFLEDMGEAPKGKWLDRIRNEVGYEPGNCRWVTPKESAANRAKGGARPNPDSLRQKALRAGRNYHMVYQRIMWGWPEELALKIPALPRGGVKDSVKKELGLM